MLLYDEMCGEEVNEDLDCVIRCHKKIDERVAKKELTEEQAKALWRIHMQDFVFNAMIDIAGLMRMRGRATVKNDEKLFETFAMAHDILLYYIGANFTPQELLNIMRLKGEKEQEDREDWCNPPNGTNEKIVNEWLYVYGHEGFGSAPEIMDFLDFVASYNLPQYRHINKFVDGFEVFCTNYCRTRPTLINRLLDIPVLVIDKIFFSGRLNKLWLSIMKPETMYKIVGLGK